MTDPFDVETAAQRRLLLAALAAYVALFVINLVVDSVFAAAAADLLLAAIVVPASAVVIRRATNRRTTDWVAVATAVAFLVAGVTIGYEGLATLDLVPPIPVVESTGTVALLVALVLYLYRSR